MPGPFCIWCSASLDDGISGPGQTLTCECGVVYSRGLVDDYDRREWEQIRARDGYEVERQYGTLVVTRIRQSDA